MTKRTALKKQQNKVVDMSEDTEIIEINLIDMVDESKVVVSKERKNNIDLDDNEIIDMDDGKDIIYKRSKQNIEINFPNETHNSTDSILEQNNSEQKLQPQKKFIWLTIREILMYIIPDI